MTSPARWLRAIGQGRAFTTVGISHLTTSRRLGTQPVKAVELAPGSYRLDGTIPWVTAAERADVLVTGAVLDDGRQMLIALPADRPGVDVRPPFPLAALQASCTTEVMLTKTPRWMIPTCWPGPRATSCRIPARSGPPDWRPRRWPWVRRGRHWSALVDLSPDRTDLAEPLEVLCENWRTYWGQLIAQARRRAGRCFPRPDPHAGQLAGSPLDSGLSHGAARNRFSPDRARPAMGAPGPLLPGLVVPDARRPGRHPRPGGVVPGVNLIIVRVEGPVATP